MWQSPSCVNSCASEYLICCWEVQGGGGGGEIRRWWAEKKIKRDGTKKRGNRSAKRSMRCGNRGRGKKDDRWYTEPYGGG